MRLEKLIKPSSAAIVGVSDLPAKFGHSAAVNMQKSRIQRVYYVHPSRRTAFGQACYPSLGDLPEVVDCALICTPAATVNPILRECGELGIHAAIVFASGFSEERSPQGNALEAELVETAARFGMLVLGPNCLGAYNAADDIYSWGMDSAHIPTVNESGIGVAAQSGWVVETFIDTDYTDIAYGISSGNGSVVSLEECLDFMVGQDSVKVVALYLEGLKKPRVFLDALRKAAESRKPLVILKGGRSALGAASAASHTGNLAGSNQAFQSVFKKYGVIAVEDFDQMITMAHTLNVLDGNLPHLPTYGGIALSGGENTLFADLGVTAGLELPPYSSETKNRLKAFIPAFATPHNPCDTTTHLFYNEEAIIGVLRAIDADPTIGAIFLSVNIDQDETRMWRHFCESVVKAKGLCAKPFFAIPASEGSRNRDLRRLLEGAGIPLMASPRTSLRCLRLLADFIQYEPRNRSLIPALIGNSGGTAEPYPLSESESKEELSRYGIPIPAHHVVSSPDGLSVALARLNAPLVLKINSAEVLHKTDVGGVKLSIRTLEEAAAAYQEILGSVSANLPGAKLNGVLVEEMAAEGLEMIVGVTSDPQLGPMLLVGLGGIHVEIFNDTSVYPAPLNKREAIEMLASLRSYKVLKGSRGKAPYDIEALADLLVLVSDYAFKNQETLVELDLNPVFVYESGHGVLAVDALIVRYPDQERSPVSRAEGAPAAGGDQE